VPDLIWRNSNLQHHGNVPLLPKWPSQLPEYAPLKGALVGMCERGGSCALTCGMEGMLQTDPQDNRDESLRRGDSDLLEGRLVRGVAKAKLSPHNAHRVPQTRKDQP